MKYFPCDQGREHSQGVLKNRDSDRPASDDSADDRKSRAHSRCQNPPTCRRKAPLDLAYHYTQTPDPPCEDSCPRTCRLLSGAPVTSARPGTATPAGSAVSDVYCGAWSGGAGRCGCGGLRHCHCQKCPHSLSGKWAYSCGAHVPASSPDRKHGSGEGPYP